jgi:excisionase family DNA binding protein
MSTENPAEVQHLLTLNQAASRLAVSRRTLERLIAEWKFPHPVKINHSSRVLLSDLEGYIAKVAAARPTA